MGFDLKNIGDVMDVSAVRTDVTMAEIDEMISLVKKYHCVCAAPMAWAAAYTIESLADSPAVVTGVLGFPSGAETTGIKAASAKELIALGCKEIDMVMNVSAFKSGMYEYTRDDIKAVVDAAGAIPVKAILEISYLTDDEIRKGSELAVEAGVKYVKTGTGWGTKPTTTDMIRMIKETIGDSALIKAAGGVRNLDMMLDMMEAGCNRFGIGVRTAKAILEEARIRQEP